MSLSIERMFDQPGYSQALSSQIGTGATSPFAPSTRNRFFCAEVIVLFVICMADALSSAWLFHAGLATEANPVLRGAAEAGTAPFLTAKFASFIPALLAAEWWRRYRPTLVPLILRLVAVGYVMIYGAGVLGQFVGLFG
jgi:hypothetical protein